jgi:hypothetical protein
MSAPTLPDHDLSAMAAAAPLPHDHNPDWVHELQRVATASHSLPGAAVRAVLAIIDAFQAEDGVLPPRACNARTALAATLEEPRTSPLLSTLDKTLHAALKLRAQREPPPEQAHAA